MHKQSTAWEVQGHADHKYCTGYISQGQPGRSARPSYPRYKEKRGKMLEPRQEITCWLLLTVAHAERKPSAQQRRQGQENGGNEDRHFLKKGDICVCQTQRIIISPHSCLLGSKRMRMLKCIVWDGPGHNWESVHKGSDCWPPTVCWDWGHEGNEDIPAMGKLAVSMGRT